MNLTQFKAFCSGAKVTSTKFPPERLDEIFTTVATMPQSLERKSDAMASSTMNLTDFLIAIVHVAYHRYAVVVRAGVPACVLASNSMLCQSECPLPMPLVQLQ